MTGRARNEKVPKGAWSGQPSALRSVVDLGELAADDVGAFEREEPGNWQRQDRPHRPLADNDKAAAVLGECPGRDKHVAGIGAGDDQVVRVMSDREPDRPRET